MVNSTNISKSEGAAKKKKRTARLGRGLSSLMGMSAAVSVGTGPQDNDVLIKGTSGAKPVIETGRVPTEPNDVPTLSGQLTQVADLEPSSGSDGISSAGHIHENISQGEFKYIPINAITVNPHQPREDFDPKALQSLADSIKSAGVMQPLLVRQSNDPTNSDTTYELVAGERRWRAAQIAGLEAVPAIVRDLTEEQLAEWSLIENIQRKDLNPIERGRAFGRLIDRFNLTHAQIAQRVGLERSSITNALRLLDLSVPVQDLIRQGRLSAGHARAIAAVGNHDQQLELARRVISQNLSVRQTETLVRHALDPTKAVVRSGARNPDPNLADLEERIGQSLQTKAMLRRGRKKGTGTLTIEFYSLDQFDALMQRLNIPQ